MSASSISLRYISVHDSLVFLLSSALIWIHPDSFPSTPQFHARLSISSNAPPWLSPATSSSRLADSSSCQPPNVNNQSVPLRQLGAKVASLELHCSTCTSRLQSCTSESLSSPHFLLFFASSVHPHLFRPKERLHGGHLFLNLQSVHFKDNRESETDSFFPAAAAISLLSFTFFCGRNAQNLSSSAPQHFPRSNLQKKKLSEKLDTSEQWHLFQVTCSSSRFFLVFPASSFSFSDPTPTSPHCRLVRLLLFFAAFPKFYFPSTHTTQLLVLSFLPVSCDREETNLSSLRLPATSRTPFLRRFAILYSALSDTS